MIEYFQGKFVKYRLSSGELRAHVDAVHAESPGADDRTGKIAEEVARCIGCACIIATVSRTVSDLNRPSANSNRNVIQEYRSVIREILRSYGILDEETGLLTAPYLHVAIHGMKDGRHGQYAGERGTCEGRSCSAEVREWFRKKAEAHAEELLPAGHQIIMDEKFVGDESKSFHRCGGGKGYEGYGPYFNTFQFEISATLRKRHQEAIIELLSRIVQEFSKVFKA